MREEENLSIVRHDIDRAIGIVIHNDHVLLMHRRSRGKEYFTFPGGGIEKGETTEDALKRELMEETSIKIEPSKLLYTVLWDKETKEFYYLSKYLSGEPQLASDSIENEEMKKDGEQYYKPLWIPLAEASKILLYPLEIRDLFFKDLKINFSNEIKEIELKRTTARQTL